MRYYGYRGRGGDPTPMVTIVGIFIIVVFIYHLVVYLRNIRSDVGKAHRDDRFKLFVEKFKLAFTPFFNKSMDFEKISYFEDMQNTAYYNVAEKKDDDGVIHIGELKWTILDNIIAFSSSGGNDESAGDRRLQHYGTLLVLRNEGFNIPVFSMMDETTFVKAKELLKMNTSVDIDFKEDKNFSDTWWLSGDDSDDVRKLFSPSIRKVFMKYRNKGYMIAGKGNSLYILTTTVLIPGPEYLKLMTDAKQIHQLLKKNKFIYTEKKEEVVENTVEDTSKEV